MERGVVTANDRATRRRDQPTFRRHRGAAAQSATRRWHERTALAEELAARTCELTQRDSGYSERIEHQAATAEAASKPSRLRTRNFVRHRRPVWRCCRP